MAAGKGKKPKGRPRLRRCSSSGKVKYPSEAEAMAEARFRNALHGNEGRKLPKRAYVCGNCKTWHLTAIEHWKET